MKLLIYSLIAGFATLLGGMIAYFLPRQKFWLVLCGGLASGLMLAVSLGNLLPAAWDGLGLRPALAGTLAGFILLHLGKIFLEKLKPASASASFLKALLIAGGIAFHDFPEGAAISVGFELQESLGLTILLAIGLHNIPEGMAVGIPMLQNKGSFKSMVLILGAVSLCTPIGALLGIILSGVFKQHLSLLLALAAGAMLYVTLCQLLPDTWKEGKFVTVQGMILGIGLARLITVLENFSGI